MAHLNHGRFEHLVVYAPAGTAKSFVLFLSGDAGWDDRAAALIEPWVQRGALVAGIDLPEFQRSLESDGGDCVFPDGDLENLSHFVQAYYRLPTYLTPILAGDAAGGTLAYAVLAQAPVHTFAGALSLDFCPTLRMNMALCTGSGVEFTRRSAGAGVEFLPARRLYGSWTAVQTESRSTCPLAAARAFVAQVQGAQLIAVPQAAPQAAAADAGSGEFTQAFTKLQSSIQSTVPAAPAVLGDLPVIEIAATPGSPPSTSFAIILSGDGGWAGLDKEVGAALAAKGIPVVGLDSLRYFWTERSPAGLGSDIDRVLRYYLAHFDKRRVLLIGYSQGADVLPFAVNRLPATSRAAVALTVVIGMSEHALFEFHVSNWLSNWLPSALWNADSGPATQPEIERLSGMPVLCIYGQDEDDSLCPKLDPAAVHVVRMPGGHHFNGDYAGLAQQILNQAHP